MIAEDHKSVAFQKFTIKNWRKYGPFCDFNQLNGLFTTFLGHFWAPLRSLSHVSFCTRDLVSRGEYKDMLLLTTVISIRCKISFLEFPSLEFEILPLDQTEQLLKAINHDFKWTQSRDNHVTIMWHHHVTPSAMHEFRKKHFSILWKMKFFMKILWFFLKMHFFKLTDASFKVF